MSTGITGFLDVLKRTFWPVVCVELAVLVVLGVVWLRGHLNADATAASASAQITGDQPSADKPHEPIMQPVRRPQPSRQTRQTSRRTMPTRTPTPAASRELPPLRQPAILIEKSRRRLTVYDQGRPVKVYDAAVGGDPADKVREGDRRTPEGRFFVCVKNPASKYVLSLGLSYPEVEDAERGLRDGLITAAEHRHILSELQQGRRPPWNTALGGEIMIHGQRLGGRDTLGCIALEDEDIRELYPQIPIGTPVIIRP